MLMDRWCFWWIGLGYSHFLESQRDDEAMIYSQDWVVCWLNDMFINERFYKILRDDLILRRYRTYSDVVDISFFRQSD